MPSSHHRKKKKHFQPPPHTPEQDRRRKSGGAASAIGVVGAVAGFGIGWFAFSGDILYSIVSLGAGAAIGYLIGRNIDRSGK